MVKYTAKQWAAREAQVLAARARLEREEVYPSRRMLASFLGWANPSVGRVIIRLKARKAWPKSALPVARRGETADRLALAASVRRGLHGGKVDVGKACAEIREKWSEATEMARRAEAYGYRPARVPRCSGAAATMEGRTS